MIRGIISFIVLAAATVALGIPAILVSLVRPGSDVTMRLGRLWSRIMLTTVGARVRYEGLEHMEARIPCVYIANHESNVDIWALVRILPAPTRFVAKQSLFRVPVLGWCLTTGGFIPIDRANRGRAIQSLRAAAKKIRGGRPVLLFPEGTRSRDGGLQPFKKGPFHLALQAGVPVVPVAISGSHRVMPPRSVRVRPGPIRVRFLPPQPVDEFLPDDYQGLLDRMHGILGQALEEDAA